MSTTTPPTPLRPVVAWGIVRDAWTAGSHHCLGCEHYGTETSHEPYQDGTAPLSTHYCRLLENGIGQEYLGCHALLAQQAEDAEAAEDASDPRGNCINTSALLLQTVLLRRPRSLRSKLATLLLARRRT